MRAVQVVLIVWAIFIILSLILQIAVIHSANKILATRYNARCKILGHTFKGVTSSVAIIFVECICPIFDVFLTFDYIFHFRKHVNLLVDTCVKCIKAERILDEKNILKEQEGK